jgi:hypothetical protein
MEKVVKDGNIAVLYSPGYGAGWFTWNGDHRACLFHPDIVKLVEEGRNSEITGEFMESLGFNDFYTGGASDLTIEWVPEGCAFEVTEYDGYESIKYRENTSYITA